MPAKLPWFRMWTESRNDAKLDALTDEEFRIWHKLLCFSAETEPRGVVDYSDPEFIAVELRVTPRDRCDIAIQTLLRVRLLAQDGDFIFFPAFAERQYSKPSDAPEQARERKRRQRERSRAVTPGHAQSRIDTETDTEKVLRPCAEPVEQPVDNSGVVRMHPALETAQA